SRSFGRASLRRCPWRATCGPTKKKKVIRRATSRRYINPMARPRPRTHFSTRETAGSIRYAKKTANRKAIRVRRAMYRNPSPSANSSTVNRTRDVRTSIRDIENFQYSIPQHFRVIAGDQDPHQRELIVEPQRPVPSIALEHKMIEFSLGAPHLHLVSAGKCQAYEHGRTLMRI